MGLLDDAIREHLELRRRHGADPGEVARQEQEALGRVRRGEAPVEEPADTDLHAGAVSVDTLPDEDARDEPAFEDDLEFDRDFEPEPEPPAPRPAAEPEAPVGPPASADQHTQQFDVDDLDLDFDEPAPAPAEPAPAERAPADPAPERREPRPPDAERPAPDDEAAGEDVLEETPEFLQETPEHDRLWFEQKPPRDFEF